MTTEKLMVSKNEFRKSERGFTMIEVSISMAIFVIVIGAIYGLLRVARSGRLNTTQRTEVLQNVRVALNAMGRDAINAGVGYPNAGALIPDNKLSILGVAADSDTAADAWTPVYARDNVNTIHCVINGTVTDVATDQVTFMYVDDSFNGGKSLPLSALSDPTGNSTVVTIQAGSTNAPCAVGDIYMITGSGGSAIGTLTGTNGTNQLVFTNTDPLNLNHPSGPSGALDAMVMPGALWKLSAVTYWVSDEDGNGSGTGTLMRRLYGGTNAGTMRNWEDQPLSFGIENLQIQYVLTDGSVVDLPSTAPATYQMDDIRQIRVQVTVRSPDIDPKTNQPFRSTVTTSFSTRNLVYEKS